MNFLTRLVEGDPKQINDGLERMRAYSYAYINYKLFPDYSIKRSGALSNLYYKDELIGKLFITYDNLELLVECDENQLRDITKLCEGIGLKVSFKKW
jgi:hypothetical protein